MSTTKQHGWMRKTAYIFNIYSSENQWDWKGVSTVEFYIPVRSKWTSYADFESFFHSVEPQFNLDSHYRISALPEPLVGCEPLLACCQVLPLTFVKAKKWYIYEQPPVGASPGQADQAAQIDALEAVVERLNDMVLSLESSLTRERPLNGVRDYSRESVHGSDTVSNSFVHSRSLLRSPPHLTTPHEDDIVSSEDVLSSEEVVSTNSLRRDSHVTLSPVTLENFTAEHLAALSPVCSGCSECGDGSEEWFYLDE
ncbi:hypothetical protein CJU90_2892 [Yarrowia sp. C11]|nr:hypothetical protein CKK34_4339 [Yarrowia sp. E02]KAG5369439.1 hypothetical protein CJU90_2892 [Yarrowia sp. C11]